MRENKENSKKYSKKCIETKEKKLGMRLFCLEQNNKYNVYSNNRCFD